MERSEDGEFSSYREYVNLQLGTLPTLEVICQEVGNENAYRAFVAASATPNQAMFHQLLFDE